MYTSSILITLAAMATGASAGCFTGGERWGSQLIQALDKVDNACHNVFTQQDIMAGAPGLGVCHNLDGGKFVSFNLENIGLDAFRRPSLTECIDGFSKEINGCEFGGSTSYTNWKYTSDPNTGSCA